MADRQNDQADGLRRMFRAERLKVIHVMAGCADVGRSTVAARLGIALARAGRETLLIDVVDGRQFSKVRRALNLHTTSASMITGLQGLSILALERISRKAQQHAAEVAACCPSLAYAIVTDCSTRCTQWLPVEAQCRELIVVLSRSTESITTAYALIKRMTVAGVSRRFHVLINRIDCEDEAALIFRNISRVAHGYLDVELELLGFVPADPAIEEPYAPDAALGSASAQSAAAVAFDRLARNVCAWGKSPAVADFAHRDRVPVAAGAA